jgi:hypothetical protein
VHLQQLYYFIAKTSITSLVINSVFAKHENKLITAHGFILVMCADGCYIGLLLHVGRTVVTCPFGSFGTTPLKTRTVVTSVKFLCSTTCSRCTNYEFMISEKKYCQSGSKYGAASTTCQK